MTMRTIHGCLALLFLGAGCSTVTVQEPVGQLAPMTDRKALEGAWVNDEGETVQVRLSKSGDLILGSLNWDDEANRFHVETATIVATKRGDFQLMHLKPDEDSDEAHELLFCRYEAQDQKTIRLYYPLVSVFETAVTSGRLKGHVEKSAGAVGVQVNASSDEVMKFLLDSGAEACFEKKPSVTFKLLKRFE